MKRQWMAMIAAMMMLFGGASTALADEPEGTDDRESMSTRTGDVSLQPVHPDPAAGVSLQPVHPDPAAGVTLQPVNPEPAAGVRR